MKNEIFYEYANELSNLFSIDKDSLFEKTKKRDIVDARHLLYYLCYKRPMRIVYIQEYMQENGYNISHSSIIHGINQVENKMIEDTDYINVINRLSKCKEI